LAQAFDLITKANIYFTLAFSAWFLKSISVKMICSIYLKYILLLKLFMKTLSLKLDNDIFDETEKITSEIKTTRNRYINEAVELYNQFNKRKLLKMQIQKESLLTKNDSLAILKEFESFVDEDEAI
jgi:hypothetical protein